MKIIKAVLVILMVVMGASAAYAKDKLSASHDIVVRLISQEPDPVRPGEFVDVRFKLDNNGTGMAENVQVEILPEFPFSLYSGDKIADIGTMQSRQRDENGAIVKFRLKVDEQAVEGENDIRIRFRVNKEAWIGPKEFKVDVQTPDAILAVDAASVDNGFLEPGKEGKLTINLANKADSMLRGIKVQLALTDMPFVTVGSSNEKSAYQMDGGKSQNFDFNLLAEPEAISGVYNLPIKIDYLDEVGNSYSKEQTVGIIIGAKPDVTVTLDDSEVFMEDTAGEVTVKVVNKGVTDIKFANLKLSESEEFRIISNSEVYLGNIDSDDFETASFKIFAEKKGKKSIKLPLTLEYKDANNNEYSRNIELSMSLYTSSEAKKLGLKEGNGFVGTSIAIAIIAAGLIGYRLYRKRKK
ncbi:COG1361 S-layer family protein [Candidatus Woesearchaeota archaeon]|nr:COG1361 S-layer family protein [Candidatus Woesearchaeota archaeon]